MNVKVLRIIARLNIGGPARNAVLLSHSVPLNYSGQAKRIAHSDKWETVLVCGEVAESEGDMMYLAKEKGIEPIMVRELGRDLSFINDLRAFWKIYRIICREKPDIIHTHTAKAGTLGRSAGILYNLIHWRKHRAKRIEQGVKTKAMLVHTFHGHVLHSYFGKIKTFFFIWIEKILALFTDRIITVSESLKRELVEKFRIAPKEKFSVVELGFELDELFKLPVKGESDCVNIGIVGRLAPVKNHRMLFRVAQGIAHPEGPRKVVPLQRGRQAYGASSAESIAKKIKFIVIGDGELREELKNYVRELGIEEMVELKKWIKDLCEIYKELDIVVLTSFNEGTPVSIIEAMAAARPVVATDVGGVRDVVQDGKNGYLVRLDDEAFMNRLLDLIEDFEKRKKFGTYGRELVRERFAKERLIRDMDMLYNTLLRGDHK